VETARAVVRKKWMVEREEGSIGKTVLPDVCAWPSAHWPALRNNLVKWAWNFRDSKMMPSSSDEMAWDLKVAGTRPKNLENAIAKSCKKKSIEEVWTIQKETVHPEICLSP
jgi:hypothetical protein